MSRTIVAERTDKRAKLEADMTDLVRKRDAFVAARRQSSQSRAGTRSIGKLRRAFPLNSKLCRHVFAPA
jgi:hypothetical protein